MIFFFGISPGRKNLGMIDGYNIYMTYTVLEIFFIPTFKWGKKFYAERAGRTYQLSDEVGKAILRGEAVDLGLRKTNPSRNTSAPSGNAEVNASDDATGMTVSGTTAADGKPVELISRTLAYQGAVINVYDDYVRVKGHEAHWDFIHHVGAAAVIPVTDKGKILMVRQYRHALQRYTLEIPAGKLDEPGEPMVKCARRELEEETGYTAGDMRFLINVNTTVAFCDELIGIFVARELKKTQQNLDDDEEINVEEWDIEDLKKLIFDGKMTDSKTIAAILAYDSRR